MQKCRVIRYQDRRSTRHTLTNKSLSSLFFHFSHPPNPFNIPPYRVRLVVITSTAYIPSQSTSSLLHSRVLHHSSLYLLSLHMRPKKSARRAFSGTQTSSSCCELNMCLTNLGRSGRFCGAY